jgi:hypothetical protein
MDDFTAQALRRLNLPKLQVIELYEIEDETLRAAKANRTVGEYCWTCTTPLILHVQDRHSPGMVVTYVDADIRFFSSPSSILLELGNRSIFIHEHDFAPQHEHLRPAAGRFNVGVVAFRNDEEGRACLQLWKSQCLNECIMDPAAGKCGDQNYLDDWPSRYRGLVISKNPGIGLAPWNITKHHVEKRRNELSVDGSTVVFYHYHALRMLRPQFGFKPTVMTKGNYLFKPDIVQEIYRPYARDLWRAMAALRVNGFSTENTLATLPEAYFHLEDEQISFSIGGLPIPVKANNRVIKILYGKNVSRKAH